MPGVPSGGAAAGVEPQHTLAAPMLALRGITKRFAEVQANQQIDLEVWPGEIHCLLGENGAGKSTLIAMLAGLQQPDAGTIELLGTPATLASPAIAKAQGIGVVQQHGSLVPTMSVLDNLLLRAGGVRLNRAAAHRQLREFCELLGTDIPPDTPLAELALGERQQLEILKVLWTNPRILVLDEPTAALDARGAERLFASIRELRGKGAAVILVTHKLGEALTLADRLTVLRRGRVAARFEGETLRKREPAAQEASVLEAMFGEAAAARPQPQTGHGKQDGWQPAEEPVREPVREPLRQPAVDTVGARAGRPAEEPVLRLCGVNTADAGQGMAISNIDFGVAAGEIIGVAGIEGQGQKHLAQVIAGQRRPSQGQVLCDGEDLTQLGVRERQLCGVRYITDDRLGEGIVPSFSIAMNLLLKRVGERPWWRFGFARRRAIAAEARSLMAEYGIQAPGESSRAGTLSGGNIQKILLARELSSAPRLVVVEKPGQGLDLQTVQAMHQAVRGVAHSGGSAVVISNDLDELVLLADRIAVLSAGRVVSWVDNSRAGRGADGCLGRGAQGEVRARIAALISGASADGSCPESCLGAAGEDQLAAADRSGAHRERCQA